MSPIRMYWWGGNSNERNFGDDLSPIMVEHVANRPIVHAELERCDLVGIGSLLDRVRMRRWKRILAGRLSPLSIWGTGSLTKLEPWYPRAKFYAVRGPRTQSALNLPASIALGDPALLISEIVTQPNKTHRWGIIPHISHQQLTIFDGFAAQQGSLRIDLSSADTLEVARQIASCDFVISSSLHGLIVADAFGIPNVWLDPGVPLSGAGYWKFYDYFESVERFGEEPIRQAVPLSELESRARTAGPRLVQQRIESLKKHFPY